MTSYIKKWKSFYQKRKQNLGRPPSIATKDVELKFRWPQAIEYISKETKSKLMALAIECGVYFFFKNFLQMFGGPIGARLTMAVARLVMQEWKDTYDKILEASKIDNC